jgi:membrane glycosyltransferase
VRLGQRARRRQLFTIPEETAPPAELRDLEQNLRATEAAAARAPAAEQDGFVRAVVDPYVNAAHQALLGPRRSLKASIRAARRALLARALRNGPAALNGRERRILLSDPEMVEQLHQGVWAIPERARATLWGRVGSG